MKYRAEESSLSGVLQCSDLNDPPLGLTEGASTGRNFIPYFSPIFPLSINTKKKVFLLLLSSPQFCFSSVIIPAREIKNHDTYNEHKYYFNLQAPVIASSWATSSGKYQGEVSTWIVQKR